MVGIIHVCLGIVFIIELSRTGIAEIHDGSEVEELRNEWLLKWSKVGKGEDGCGGSECGRKRKSKGGVSTFRTHPGGHAL